MKKLVIGLVSIAVLGTGGYVAYNTIANKPAKQDVTRLKVDNSSKPSDKSKDSDNSDTDKSSDSGDSSANDKVSDESKSDESKSDESKNSESQDKTIDDNIDNIKVLVGNINDFRNASSKAYEKLKTQFAKYNVTLDDTVKGPYGIFDPISKGADQSAVLAGINLKTDVQKTDTGYTFVNTTRTGQGAMNGSASATGGIIRKALKTDKYKDSEKTVTYQLDVNPDGKSGTLKLVSGQWW